MNLKDKLANRYYGKNFRSLCKQRKRAVESMLNNPSIIERVRNM